MLCLMETIILFYITQPLFDPREYVSSHRTYFEEILLELRINSYKVGIIFAVYRRMRSKWTYWAGTSLNFSEVFTWIDALYDVHDNTRSHTGGAISIVYGIIHGKLSKQNINVQSSTEAELVGMSEYITYNLWLIMFLKE